MHVNSSQPTGDAYSASHTLSLDSKMVRERGREMVREGDRKGKRGKRRRREKEREGKGREGKVNPRAKILYTALSTGMCA